MSDGRAVARIAGVIAGGIAAVSVAGIVVMLALNAFVLDKYDAYGEVPIPGKSTVYLPAGDVSVNFHAQVIGSPGGGGLPFPPLTMSITPPAGIPDPEVVENHGSTTTINGDAHRRVWEMRVQREGGYAVDVTGPVGGFINPRLAFGDNAGIQWPIWVLLALALFSMDLAVAVGWFRRRRRSGAAGSFAAPANRPVADPFTPTDEGIRLEQLKTIAALRDSGALTDKEFEAEKRRILDGR